MIAQVGTPAEGLSSSYFLPLILAGVLYVALFVAARVLDGRGDARSENAADAAFLLMLLSAAYTAILAVVAVASEMDLIWDLVRILVVVTVFFGLLILILLLVFERAIGGLSRMRRRD